MPSPLRFLSLSLLFGLALVTSAHTQPLEPAGGGALHPHRANLPRVAPQEAPVAFRLLQTVAVPLRAPIADRESTHGPGTLSRRLIPRGTPDPVNPQTATRRALLFPGGGHFYTGATARGAALLGIAAGSLIAGALLSSRGGPCKFVPPDPNYERCAYDHTAHQDRIPANYIPLVVGVSGAGGAYTVSLLDAPRSAHRVLQKYGLPPVAVLPESLVAVDWEGRARMGVRLRLSQ